MVSGVSPCEARAGTSAVGSVGYSLNCPMFMSDCSRDADPYSWPLSCTGYPYPVPLERTVLSYATAPGIEGMSMLL